MNSTEVDSVSVEGGGAFERNRELICIAQGDDDELAMKAQEELLSLNLGLIRTIALRFRERGVEFEDLMQIGSIGMIKAIRSFDLERGTSFSTYAVPLIFGEIRRHIRDEGPIKISRYYKKLGAMLMNERNNLLQSEGREAQISELAARCSVDAQEAVYAMEAISPIISLSDHAYMGDDEGVELGDTIRDSASEDELEIMSDRIALGEAISKMSELWQKIVLLRYYRNFTQQQTADSLGLSQVKVSREEKKIVNFLREQIS